MNAVQQLTGGGGWPTSVWLNAAREPFFGGTYFPPRNGDRGARQGFLSLLGALSDTFQRDPDRVSQASTALVQAIREDMQGAAHGANNAIGLPASSVIDVAIDHFKRSFDPVHGGLSHAPKLSLIHI